MPTVVKIGGYRLYFYSHEPNEPPHIHVDKADLSAKLWLTPPSVARNYGFSAKELGDLIRLVRDNRNRLLEAWHAHFGPDR
jgi:hypothetical protein